MIILDSSTYLILLYTFSHMILTLHVMLLDREDGPLSPSLSVCSDRTMTPDTVDVDQVGQCLGRSVFLVLLFHSMQS